MPVRLVCTICRSLFLTAELLKGRPLCHRCATVAAAVTKHSRPKRKPPNGSAKNDPTSPANKPRK